MCPAKFIAMGAHNETAAPPMRLPANQAPPDAMPSATAIIYRFHGDSVLPSLHAALGIPHLPRELRVEAVIGRLVARGRENRLVTANFGGTSTGYVYDGLGERVAKLTCPAGTNPCTPTSTGATIATTYIYDAFGNLAAEYGDGDTPACNPTTSTCYPPYYLTVDDLGSTRTVTDSQGNVVRRYDFLPFGGELGAGTDGRTTGLVAEAGGGGIPVNGLGRARWLAFLGGGIG